MKLSVRHLFLCAALASNFTLTPAIFAQDTKQSDQPAPAPAASESTAGKTAASPSATSAAAEKSPAAVEPKEDKSNVAPSMEEPAVPAATPAPAEPAIAPEPAAEKSDTQPKVENSEPAKLRRLDTDSDESIPVKPRTQKAHERSERARQRAAVRANRVDRDVVNVFSDSTLSKDEKVDNVVAVFGNSTAEGEVTDSVVAVFGNSHASGPVGDAVVAILGDGEVTGTVGDSTVVVLGNLSLNSHVKGDVVTVLGDIKLGPAAEVDGNLICVGGAVTKASGAVLHHGIQKVGFGTMHSAVGLKAWFRQCFMYARPLAFGPDLLWAWWIAGAFLAFYALLALIFGKGINKCAETFEQRPGYSFLTALLTLLVGPIATIVLAITGVGVFIIPFLAGAIFLVSLFGKAVMLAWIGRRIAKPVAVGQPALAVLIGGVIVMLLYTIWGSFILYKLIDWVGMGVVIYTLLGVMKRAKPVVPPAAPVYVAPATGVPVSPAMPVMTGDPLVDAAAATVGIPSVPVMVAPVSVTPPILPAAMLPRAGFWSRTAALLLDVVIVAIICSLLSGFFSFGSHVHVKGDLLPALAFYGAVMWKLRGTTVGGIICGLKVIRLDDRPIDWGTAIVRALGCFLSLFVAGLGFIWVVFDDQRQSWHDKIAGTTVVYVPKGTPLI